MKIFDAVHALVHDSTVPPKAIAEDAGIRYGYLMRAADPNEDDVQFQARWIAPATIASGNDVVIKQIAHECGGVFVRLQPKASNDALTAKTLKEVGEYFTKLAECSPGGYSKADVAAIEVEGEDVITAVYAQLAKLKAEAK